MAIFETYDPTTDLSDTQSALIAALIAGSTTLNVSDFSGITIQGTPASINFYDGSIAELGVGAGLLLTTGGTPGTANTEENFSISNGLPGDPQLDAIVPNTRSFDATELSFTLDVKDSTVNSLQFSVVFGSEEFPEFVDSFPDIAAVFVNGKNFALFNNEADQPLSVSSNNLAAGNFQDNAGSLYAPLEYDGISKTLTFIVPIKIGANDIKIAIADLNDSALDSGLFISGLKLISNGGGGGLFTDVDGDEKPNTLQGNENDQNFNGGGGDDTINGGGGDDVLNGDDGNDQSSGDGGNDEINGGDGDQDMAEFSGNFADYLISLDQETGYLIVADTRPNSPDGQDKVGPDVEFLKFADQTIPTVEYFTPPATVFFSTIENDVFNATETITTVSYEQSEIGVKVQLGLTGPQKTGHGNDTLNGIQNLTGSEFADKLTGNAFENTIRGLGGNDRIDGAGGNDTMIGGTGNDTYTVQSIGDEISEAADEGFDAVNSSANEYMLSANVEKLTLLAGAIGGYGNDGDNSIGGNADDNFLIGNDGNDKLTGGAGNDELFGGSGNDRLDGGIGADVLAGGTGDDGYTVDNADDVVIEDADEGNDSVNASISYTLGINTERLTLTGSAAIDGTGNDRDNSISGNGEANTLRGLDGNDRLAGGAGSDTLEGSAGNDKLDGGIGGDTLIGGTGDDGYTVDSTEDTVTENADEGNDSVNASISYTLGINTERLTLTGLTAIDGTGNARDNSLTGNEAANTLRGLEGNDRLAGAGGSDTLEGGAGNDRLNGGIDDDALIGGTGDDGYTVDNAGDVVTENADEGFDSVTALISYTLAANTERLVLSGTDAIDGTGNESANTISGNAGSNMLWGMDGRDSITGGEGDDVLSGGMGADRLGGGAGADAFRFDVLESAANFDTVRDFASGIDRIEISRAAFGAFAGEAAGTISAAQFGTGTAATTADQHLIYNTATGGLFYDADGAGEAAAVQIALFSGRPALAAADFVLI